MYTLRKIPKLRSDFVRCRRPHHISPGIGASGGRLTARSREVNEKFTNAISARARWREPLVNFAKSSCILRKLRALVVTCSMFYDMRFLLVFYFIFIVNSAIM